MEVTIQREKELGRFQTRCYNCRSVLTYEARDVHRNPGANRVVSRHGFRGYDGEIRCPNCHSWLPHYLRNEMSSTKLVVYTGEDRNAVVPNNIRRIENMAFSNEGIRSVVLPDGLVEIGGKAFEGTPIREIVVPASVRIIEDYAFRGCANLERIAFEGGSRGLEVIGESAFAETAVRELILPASVQYVGTYAFYKCEYLQRIVFEGAPQSLGTQIIGKCPNVRKIEFKSGGFPQRKDLFEDCIALEEIDCPDNLRSFADAMLQAKRSEKWRAAGLCEFCGGEFSGGLIKRCSVCGNKKSYK